MNPRDDEYDYLFKGKLFFYFTLCQVVWLGQMTHGLIALLSSSRTHRRLWSWKVKSIVQIYKKRVQLGEQVNDWCRIRHQVRPKQLLSNFY